MQEKRQNQKFVKLASIQFSAHEERVRCLIYIFFTRVSDTIIYKTNLLLNLDG